MSYPDNFKNNCQSCGAKLVWKKSKQTGPFTDAIIESESESESEK